MQFKYIEKFSDFLIDLIGIYKVDKEGYVVHKNDGGNVNITVGGKKRPLKVIRSVNSDTDAVILNPINEGMGDREDTRWFYTALAAGLYRRLVVFAEYLNAVKDLSDNDETVDAETLKKLSQLCKYVNKTVVADMTKFSPLDFINVFYNKRSKRASLRCVVYEEGLGDKVKAKNRKVLKSIFDVLFDVSDSKLSERYTFKSDSITCPKLTSILTVYYKLYDAINEFLFIMDDDVDLDFIVDLTEFSTHLGNIDEYYEKTKWISQNTSQDSDEADDSSPLKANMPSTDVPEIVSSSIPSVTSTVTQSTMPMVVSSNIPGQTVVNETPVAQMPHPSMFQQQPQQTMFQQPVQNTMFQQQPQQNMFQQPVQNTMFQQQPQQNMFADPLAFGGRGQGVNSTAF